MKTALVFVFKTILVVLWLLVILVMTGIDTLGSLSAAPGYLVLPVAASAPVVFGYILLRLRRGSPKVIAVAEAILLALLFNSLLKLTRMHESADLQLRMLQQAGACLLFLAINLGLYRSRGKWILHDRQRVDLALLLAAILALPWILVGALGSALDTVLGGLTGLLYGAATATVLCISLLPSFFRSPRRRMRDLVLATAAAAVIALFMTSSFGGGSLPFLLSLPALFLGILAVLLAWYAPRIGITVRPPLAAVGLLMGIGMAIALAFIDPAAASRLPVIDGGPKLWLHGPPIAGALLSLVLALGILLLRRGPRTPIGRTLLAAAAVLSWAAVVLIYFGFGHVGFFGNRMIVVLEAQADLSALTDPQVKDAHSRETAYRELVHVANATQADLRARLRRAGVDHTPFYIVNALEVDSADFPVRWWLSRQPGVSAVLTSQISRPLPPGRGTEWREPFQTDQPARDSQWGIKMIGAEPVWERFGVRGEGVVIGIVDTGVDWTHPELAPSYRGNPGSAFAGHDYNWFDTADGSPVPIDLHGHGTSVLSVIVGKSLGIASDARWIACRYSNLESPNISTAGSLLKCLEFMLAPFPLDADPFTDGLPLLAPNVVNLSWGCSECTQELMRPAMHALRAAGILALVAAGNEGPGCDSLGRVPASLPEVLTVGAIAEDGTIAPSSSRGSAFFDGRLVSKPDIYAPGASILVAVPGRSFATASGTSFAAPFVTGAVALLWSANPAMIGDVTGTKDLLIASSTRLDPSPSSRSVDTCQTDGLGTDRPAAGLLNTWDAMQAMLAP